MTPLPKLIWRDLLTNRGRVAVSVFAILVSVSLIVWMMGSYDTLVKEFDNDAEAYMGNYDLCLVPEAPRGPLPPGGQPRFADPELAARRLRARMLTARYNGADPEDDELRRETARELLGSVGEGCYLEPPFRCDYGSNISLGDRVYANFNLVILDCARVEIGNDVLIGPNVGIYTAGHPVDPGLRQECLEFALPIAIEDGVWIGGHVAVAPGVRIGRNSVIGAGSVVTRDIPPGVVAAGNPCRVLRPIAERDREFYAGNRRVDGRAETNSRMP